MTPIVPPCPALFAPVQSAGADRWEKEVDTDKIIIPEGVVFIRVAFWQRLIPP